MKHIIRLSVILITLLLFNNTFAAENITGTWQGKLVIAPETELKIQFNISQNADGSYAVILNSPEEGGIKDVKANSVAFDSGNLKLEVAELSGTYDGVVKDGKIEGTWKQEGTSMPLSLSPYVKPTLTKEDKERLLGPWRFELSQPGGSFKGIYRFEVAQNGEFVGFVDSPDMGVFGVPFSSIEFEENILTVKVESTQAEFKGTMSGDEIVGEFKQRGQQTPVTLKKGPLVYNLNLAEDDMEKLLGEWNGPLTIPTGSLTVVFRFEKTKEGNFVAFHDSPDQGGKDLPVTEAAFSDGKITLKMKGNNAEFNGKLTGDEMVGEWTQRGQSLPLTLKKGEYKAPEYSLSLSAEAMGQLLGEWQGKLGPLSLVFRFEKTEKGDFKGFIDSPDQGAKGIKITEAALTDGRLVLKVKVPTAEFNGQLSGNSLVGEWKQGGQSNPLTLTKK